MKKAITCLCQYNNDGNHQLSVRQKTKDLPGNRFTWWFVLHDEEEHLTELEKSWDAVELQTQWKIEPCYMPATANPHSPGPNPGTHVQPDDHGSRLEQSPDNHGDTQNLDSGNSVTNNTQSKSRNLDRNDNGTQSNSANLEAQDNTSDSATVYPSKPFFYFS